jgi:metal-responsive CopG/Arc/MetJ family transcriptional regulator
VGEARMMEDNERITIRVPTGMKQKLDKRIKKENMFASRSELIRHLLQNFLADPNRRRDKRRIR